MTSPTARHRKPSRLLRHLTGWQGFLLLVVLPAGLVAAHDFIR